MSSTIKLSILVVLLAICQLASAQGRRGRGQSGGDDTNGGPDARAWRGQRGGGDQGGGQDFRGKRGLRPGGDMGGGPNPRAGRDNNRPGPGGDDVARRTTRTQEFLKGLDANGNGIIEADEAAAPAAKMMLDRIFSQMGKQPHFPMAITEIMQGYEAGLRAGGNPGGGSGGAPSAMAWTSPPGLGSGPPSPPPGGLSASKSVMPAPSGPPGANPTGPTPAGGSTPSSGSAAASQGAGPGPAASPEEAKPVPRMPARFKRGLERLPKGLPDWYLSRDVNGEGQITMAKFISDSPTPEEVEMFNQYDLNHDGVITAEEALKYEQAKAGGSKRGH